jgi:hypothetical protein
MFGKTRLGSAQEEAAILSASWRALGALRTSAVRGPIRISALIRPEVRLFVSFLPCTLRYAELFWTPVGVSRGSKDFKEPACTTNMLQIKVRAVP